MILTGNHYYFIASCIIVGYLAIVKKRHAKKSIPKVHHFIPWFGSAFAISKMGIYEWIKSNLAHGPIFQATIMGRSHIFVTDHVAARQILNAKDSDITAKNLDEMFVKRVTAMKPSDAKISLSLNYHSFFQKHLMTEDLLSTILFDMQNMLNSQMPTAGNTWIKYRVKDIFGKMLTRTTVAQLADIPGLECDEMLNCINLFVERIDEVAFRSPFLQKFFCREVYNAREKVVSYIREKLMQEDTSSISGHSSKGGLRREISAFCEKNGISVDGRARGILPLLFGALVNSGPAVHSIINRILENSTVYKEVLDEVLNISQQHSHEKKLIGGGFTLPELNEMVKLDSIFTETLRLDNTRNAYRFRRVARDLDLKLALSNGDKVAFFAAKGSTVVTCPPIMNCDEEVFTSAEEFRWDRFLARDGKAVEFHKNGTLLSSPVEAFGGGSRLCPGRNLARAFAKSLIAKILIEYDIRFVDDVIPDVADVKKKISYGRSPKSDVTVELRRRH
jgi:hypothetical protein